MNVQFSRSFNGFNRDEVIEYIRKLTHEKTRAEKDTIESAERLEDAEAYIKRLENELFETHDNIRALEHQINEKETHIEQLEAKIRELEDKLYAADNEKHSRLNPIRLKTGSAEASLYNLASQLTDMAQRVEQAYTSIYDATVLIDNYAIGADENGNF